MCRWSWGWRSFFCHCSSRVMRLVRWCCNIFQALQTKTRSMSHSLWCCPACRVTSFDGMAGSWYGLGKLFRGCDMIVAVLDVVVICCWCIGRHWLHHTEGGIPYLLRSAMFWELLWVVANLAGLSSCGKTTQFTSHQSQAPPKKVLEISKDIIMKIESWLCGTLSPHVPPYSESPI